MRERRPRSPAKRVISRVNVLLLLVLIFTGAVPLLGRLPETAEGEQNRWGVVGGSAFAIVLVVLKQLYDDLGRRTRERSSAMRQAASELLIQIKVHVDGQASAEHPDFEALGTLTNKRLHELLVDSAYTRHNRSWYRTYVLVWGPKTGFVSLGEEFGPMFAGPRQFTVEALQYLIRRKTVAVFNDQQGTPEDWRLRPPDPARAYLRVAERAGPHQYCVVCIDAQDADALDRVDLELARQCASQLALGLAFMRYRSLVRD